MWGPGGCTRSPHILTIGVVVVSLINIIHAQVPLQVASSGVPITSAAQGQAPLQPLPPVGVPLPPHDPVIVPLGGGAAAAPVAPYVPITKSGGGGLKSISDPLSDVGVQKLMRHPDVLHRLQVETKADSAVKISQLITAHKQVVSGQMTYMSLKVSETLCPVGTRDVVPCQEDVTEDPYICEIAVWERPWINSTKIIDEKTRCEDTEDDADFKSLKHPLHKPVTLSSYAQSITSLPSGSNDKQIAVEAFNYVDRGSDSDFEGRLVNYDITNMMFDPTLNMTQVRVNLEYGFTLCLKSQTKRSLVRTCPADNTRANYICSVTVIDTPNDLMRLQVVPDDDDDIQCSKKATVDEELVVAVQAPCLGCPQPAPLNDPTVLDIAEFAVTEFDRTSDDDDLHMFLRLVKASTQVVSGIKYFLTLEIAETDCNKAVTGVDINRTYCNQDHKEETKVCDIHIIDQAWIPSRELVYAKCYDKDSYPDDSHEDEFIVPVSSSPSAQGPNKPLDLDAGAKAAVDYVVLEYNKREVDDLDDAYYKLVKVHESSIATLGRAQERHLVIELGETNCFQNSASVHIDLNNCSLNPWEEHEVCEVKVLEQNVQNVLHRSFTYYDCDDLDDYLFKKTAKSIQSFSRQNQPFLAPSKSKSGQSGLGTKLPVNDTEALEAAGFVVKQFNLQSDEDEVYVLSQLLSAYSQVQSGVKYELELELFETHCKKYQPIQDTSKCPIDYSEEPQVCQAEVVVQADAQKTKSLGRLYCDDRDDYYIKKISAKVGVAPSHSTGHHAGSRLSEAVNWTPVDVNSRKLIRLAEFVADEFDLRSDEDNVFIMSKLHTAKQQVESGLNYYLTVEIAETVCPKYKQGINKTRCAVDIGEEHKMCEAIIQEQVWLSKRQVVELQCADVDDFYEGDDSREILYPNVHPTAHARPVFASQFKTKTTSKSQVSPKLHGRRRGESKESDESNEFKTQQSFESAESNEKYYNQPGQTNFQHHVLFDSDEGYDSDESRHWFRGKRSIPGGFTTQSADHPHVKAIADFALDSMDQLLEDPRARKVTTVLSAASQVVAGVNWHLRVGVAWTTCLKEDQPEDLKLCSQDTSEPELICDLIVWEKPWLNTRKVTKSACRPNHDIESVKQQ